VSTSEVDTWRSVSFWTEKLTEVLIWSFPKIEVSSVMQIETHGTKNVFNPKIKYYKINLKIILNFLRCKITNQNSNFVNILFSIDNLANTFYLSCKMFDCNYDLISCVLKSTGR
jgi:hypothetical protein